MRWAVSLMALGYSSRTSGSIEAILLLPLMVSG